MFLRSKRVRRDPYSLSIFEAEQPIRLDERYEAWARTRREWPAPEFRSHRGMLPDVDLSNVVAVETGPRLITRLFRRLFSRRKGREPPGETSGRTEGSHAALGEAGRKPYVWLVGTESEFSDPAEFEPKEPATAYNGSRAA
jgi:hypothetical protein